MAKFLDENGVKTLWNNINASTNKTKYDIVINGGPLADQAASVFTDGKIPAGMSIEEILNKLLCQVLWPTPTTSTVEPSLTAYTVSNPTITASTNTNTTVEVGTKINIPTYITTSGLVGSIATNSAKRTISNMEWGYATDVEGSNKTTDKSKTITGSYGAIVAPNSSEASRVEIVYNLSVGSITGFASDVNGTVTKSDVFNTSKANVTIPENTNNQIKPSDSIYPSLSATGIAYANDGENKMVFNYTIAGGKYTTTYTNAETTVYYASNLGTFDNDHKVELPGVEKEVEYHLSASSNATYKITGARYGWTSIIPNKLFADLTTEDINSACHNSSMVKYTYKSASDVSGKTLEYEIKCPEGSDNYSLVVAVPKAWNKVVEKFMNGLGDTQAHDSTEQQINGANGYKAVDYKVYVLSLSGGVSGTIKIKFN